MADLRIDPLNIIHYVIEGQVSDTDIATAGGDPLVVVQAADTYDRKHMQVRILPFNDANTDKAVLTFADKLQYFRKEIRTSLKSTTSLVQVAEDDTVLANLVTDFFDLSDGTADEFAEFMTGWNTKPVTGFEDDLPGFFGGHFLDLPADALTSMETGLGVSA